MVSEKLISDSYGDSESEIRVLVWVGSDESLSPGYRPPQSSHGRKNVRKLSGDPFIRTLISFIRAPHSWTNHLPMAPSSITIYCKFRFQHMQFETTQHSVDCSLRYLLIQPEVTNTDFSPEIWHVAITNV